VGDLRGVSGVPVPNSLLESVETGLFVVDQSTTLLAIMGIQGSDEAPMGVQSSLQFQHASDGGEGRAGFAQRQSLRVDLRSRHPSSPRRAPGLGL
jgi:hypothetical protein